MAAPQPVEDIESFRIENSCDDQGRKIADRPFGRAHLEVWVVSWQLCWIAGVLKLTRLPHLSHPATATHSIAMPIEAARLA